MPFYLLDAGGAFLLVYFLIIGLIFLVVALFIEAGVMSIFKYHDFKKSLGQSLIVNSISFLIGLVLFFFANDMIDLYEPGGFLILWGVTVVSEGLALYFLNRDKPVMKTVLITLVMNIVSYLILYLFMYVTD